MRGPASFWVPPDDGSTEFAGPSRAYGWDRVNHALVEGYLRVIRQRDGGLRLQSPSPVP